MRAKIYLRYLQVNISEKHLTARGREAPAVCDTHASVQYLRLKFTAPARMMRGKICRAHGGCLGTGSR